MDIFLYHYPTSLRCLALKAKYYNKSIYYIAEKLYGVEPDEQFLQVICSLLIKEIVQVRNIMNISELAVEPI